MTTRVDDLRLQHQALQTARLGARTDVNVVASVIATEVPALAIGGTVSGVFASKAGAFDLRVEGNELVGSLRYAVSASSMPTDGAVDAASPVNGRATSVAAVLATTAIDGKVYVKARFYSGASGAGDASSYVQQTFRRDTSTATKTWIVDGADFNAIDTAQAYRRLTKAFTLGAGSYPIADVYGFTPAGAGALTVEGVKGLPLPIGAVIIAMRTKGAVGGGASACSVKLQKVDQFGSVSSTIATVAAGGASGVLSETVPSTHSYQLHATVTNGAGRADLDAVLYKVEVDYTAGTYEVTR